MRRAFTAIVKLTLRNAVRSHVFQLLLGLLVLYVALVPTTVTGGTVTDFIRVSLLYSLSGIGTILSLSALWVGCHVMSADIDSYQLHMVVSKPVSRVTIWLGKWTGVLVLHLVLLVFSALAVYGVIVWRFERGDFPKAERERIRREVMVGRRVFLPERRDYEKEANELKDDKIRARLREGKRVDTSPKAQDALFKQCLKELISRDSEVKPAYYPVKLDNGREEIKFSENIGREWIYRNVPGNAERLLYLRYRPYVGKVKSEEQRQTMVGWFLYAPRRTATGAADAAVDETSGKIPVFKYYLRPVEVMSGEFHELRLPGDKGIVSPEGEVRLGVHNLDAKFANQFYQPADGPKLLVEITGFFGNYLRGVTVLALQLVLMTALSCSFGGFLTLPTAVFMSTSYLVFGFLASFMTDREFYVDGKIAEAGQWMSWKILDVVVPLERFDVSELISGGELVEWSLIWNVTWSCLLLRMLPLVLFGMYFYWRREMGLALRK